MFLDFFNFWKKHRNLILRLTWLDIQSRYRGSLFGIAWAIITPLILLAIYTFVFSVIFQARWNRGIGAPLEFGLLLFFGLIFFSVVSETLQRSPNAVMTHSNLIKKLLFPAETIPCATVGSALVHSAFSLLPFSIGFLAVHGLPPLTALYLPLLVIPLLFFCLAISWFLAALGVYLRDLAYLASLLTTLLMLLSPLFYPSDVVPLPFRYALYINPLTYFMEESKNLLFWGEGINWSHWLFATCLSWLLAWLGFRWFMRVKVGFADVL